MSSEKVSIITVNPFIRKFVFAIIQSIRLKDLSHKEKTVIHADLVPKVSEKVMQASLGEKISSENFIRKKDINKLIVPIMKPKIVNIPTLSTMPARRIMPPRSHVPEIVHPKNTITPPVVPHETHVGQNQDYGKITPLLNDPSVFTIECQGIGEPIMVIRSGQRQITKIVLNTDDIKNLLEKIADTAHIPLLEGVFRATIDNFSVNAVISEMIGSKFIIKKQMVYTMQKR